MRKNQQGFGAIELLLIIIVVGLIGVAAVYAYSHKANVQHSSVASTAGWSTFKSAVSSIQFSYPPSWQLIKSPSTSDAPAWHLESVYVKGPNNFSMYLSVDKTHTNPALNCASFYHTKPVTLNGTYDMVMEGPSSKNIYNISLISQQNTAALNRGTMGCPLFYYPNSLGSNEGYQFSGQYQEQGNPNYHDLSESSFMAQPEVVIAKSIFSSFQQ